VIHEIDPSALSGSAGQKIRIRATDDCGLAKVTVQLLDPAEKVLESGEAVLGANRSPDWEYTTQVSLSPGQEISIQAVAYDRAGNKAIAKAAKQI